MPLEPGTRLGKYEVLSLLGAGGMGEVYAARDGELGRRVALKLLLEEVAGDPDRLARFRREAQVLASLNHTNIATLHGFETSGDTHFLVMELVEGETLADRIARGPMPLGEALTFFLQIAEGLEAAHEKGVVHRDLKPANVKLGFEGEPVKILDFGLAKAVAPEADPAPADSKSMSPTLTLAATRRGEILGTAAYMSPEQAKGKTVDRRTDVWAFGACLFEALSGKRPFPGDGPAEVMAAVLKSEPPWEALPDSTPPVLARLLRRTLAKEPRRRLRDIGDVRLELEEVRDRPASEAGTIAVDARATEATERSPRALLRLGAEALGVAAIAVLAVLALRPDPPRPVARTLLNRAGDPPIQVEPFVGLVALSPDGRTAAYTTDHGIYVRDVGELGSRRVTETGRSPFFSPDGQWMGYIDQSRIRKVPVRGGPALDITRSSSEMALSATWGDDDTIVFNEGNTGVDLFRVRAAGGEPERIELAAADGLVDVRWPELLPGSNALLVTLHRTAVGRGPAQLAALDLTSGRLNVLAPVAGRGLYSRGYVVYGVEGKLMAARFDPKHLDLVGDATPVVEGVMTKALSGGADFALSNEGALLYAAGALDPASSRRPVWRDRHGNVVGPSIEPGSWGQLSVSPDGSRVALTRRSVAGTTDIWIWDLARDALTRLTFDEGNETNPVWSADGSDVFFAGMPSGTWDVYRRSADGAGNEELIVSSAENIFPFAVSPDGESLLYASSIFGELSLAALSSDRAPGGEPGGPTPLLSGRDARFDAPSFSKSGRWLAYSSDETGSHEVYVRPFPNVEDGRWQVSTEGGMFPLWGPNDSEILFLSPETGSVLRAPVQTEGRFRVGSVELLFERSSPSPPRPGFGAKWGLGPKGERLLFLDDVPGEEPGTDLVLVQGFLEELKRQVP